MLIDYHVHSKYSDDSEYPMEQVILDAIECGLDEICSHLSTDIVLRQPVRCQYIILSAYANLRPSSAFPIQP